MGWSLDLPNAGCESHSACQTNLQPVTRALAPKRVPFSRARFLTDPPQDLWQHKLRQPLTGHGAIVNHNMSVAYSPRANKLLHSRRSEQGATCRLPISLGQRPYAKIAEI
jgi:hypothetical protein